MPNFIQNEWMELSEMLPGLNINDLANEPIPDAHFNWLGLRDQFNQNEILRMTDWIEKKKLEEVQLDDNLPIVLPEQLNQEQLQAYNIIKENNEKKNQLFMIIIGTAGTGKSYTVSAISHYLKNSLKRAAPTGKAAFIINGETIHSLFQINVSNSFKKLTGIKLKNLQDTFKNVDFIIIDEYSMLGEFIN